MTAPVIDVHTHLLPDLSVTGARAGVARDADGRLVVDGHRLGLPGLYDAAALVDTMAGHGIGEAWVSPPPPAYRQGMDRAATETWVRALDAGMRARIAERTELDRLTYLPLDQPSVALALAGDVTDAVGWTASAGGGSPPLDDADLEPLWQQLEECGKPVLLHPGASPDQRMDALYLANLLGNPVETGLAAAQLLLGGVLARHPGLKVLLVHCGGVTPALVGRWARGVATARPGIADDTADPRRTVRSLWVDTLAHSPALVDLALSVLGPDRLVLGSDYPFPMGVSDPHESIAHLSPDLRRRIGRNAASLVAERRPA